MKKKKVLVHGTQESLQKFFADAVSRDFEIIAALSEENISVQGLEVIAPQDLPKFNYKLVDGIIFTSDNKSAVNYFIEHKFEPRKIIIWDAAQGWRFFGRQEADGSQAAYLCGLEFHIRSEEDAKFFNETHWRLQNNWQVRNLNPQLYPEMLARSFYQRTGRPLDFNNPKTFTEKLQWLKIYDATPIKSRLADKYAVRSWIAEKIGDEYLIPLLGVWENFDDINFDDLPDQFVLKCNHGSGMNVICRDKTTFDVQNAREKLNAWLAQDYSYVWSTFELHYTRIERKIIAEKFMTDRKNFDLIDYKFWCFDGKPVVIQLQTDTTGHLRIDHFDLNWNLTNIVRSDHPNSDHPEKIRRPKNFKLMKKLAAKLAEGFAHVRVDFYEIDGKVYFGEMTFTPGAGNFYYKSAGTDEYLGSLLKLPNPTPPPTAFA